MNEVIDTLEKEHKFSPLSSLGMEISHVMIASMAVVMCVLGCGLFQTLNAPITI
jgi:hypothetical protein